MKRFLSLFLACLFLLPLCACAQDPAAPKNNLPKTLRIRTASSAQINTGSLITDVEESAAADALALLGTARKTETEVSPLLPIENAGQYDAEYVQTLRGYPSTQIYWLETEKQVYRYLRNEKQWAAVNDPAGSGTVLDLTEEQARSLYYLCRYYTHDAWEVQALNKDGARRIGTGDPDAELKLISCRIGPQNTLVAEIGVTAKKALQVTVSLIPDDQYIEGLFSFRPTSAKAKEVLHLERGESRVCTLTCAVDGTEYVIACGNSYLHLLADPMGIPDAEYPGNVILLRPQSTGEEGSCAGSRIEITGETAKQLRAILDHARFDARTGWISRELFDAEHILPTATRMIWLKHNGKCYRFHLEDNTLHSVNDPYGDGTALLLPQKETRLLRMICEYAPNAVYQVHAKKRNQITITNEISTEPNAEIGDFQYAYRRDPLTKKMSLIVNFTVTALQDLEGEAILRQRLTPENAGPSVPLRLKKGESQTVTLECTAGDSGTTMALYCGNVVWILNAV